MSYLRKIIHIYFKDVFRNLIFPVQQCVNFWRIQFSCIRMYFAEIAFFKNFSVQKYNSVFIFRHFLNYNRLLPNDDNFRTVALRKLN